jgi:hypothetical protein
VDFKTKQNKTNMKKTRVIQALKAQALADREKALMALDLLENQAVGIGDHTANDFLKDATESLQLLAEAEDRLDMIEKYFNHEKSN